MFDDALLTNTCEAAFNAPLGTSGNFIVRLRGAARQLLGMLCKALILGSDP
jgi:hypothetical protein